MKKKLFIGAGKFRKEANWLERMNHWFKTKEGRMFRKRQRQRIKKYNEFKKKARQSVFGRWWVEAERTSLEMGLGKRIPKPLYLKSGKRNPRVLDYVDSKIRGPYKRRFKR